MADTLPRFRRTLGAFAGAIAVALAGALWVGSGPLGAQQAVGLELVLAVDASGSVDNREFDLQRQGLAAAFRDPAVVAAIRRAGTVAVSLVQWAGPDQQGIDVAWVTVTDGKSAAALADRIAATERRYYGTTAITALLERAVAMLRANRIEGLRQVIDISGDGPNNSGQDPDRARDWALAAGITVNGLVILNEDSSLDRYYRDHVIGGPGAFLVDARDYRAFAAAIRAKLIREIRGAPVAGIRPVRPTTAIPEATRSALSFAGVPHG